MSTDFHLRVQQVLERALSATPARREALIRECCAGDARLLDEALAMLPHYMDAPRREPQALNWRPPATTTLWRMRREAHSAAIAETEPRPPFSLDQYTVVSYLGAGGMGVVYRAVQPVLDREVAIKILRCRLRTTEDHRRFAFEGEVLRQLQHPGIARFKHSGIARLRPQVPGTRVLDQRPYFVMEYVRGEPLTWFAEAHRLDLAARLDLLLNVCDAVEYAHYRGIVHCDLKPDNILVDADGYPKVVDFGIARFTEWQRTSSGVGDTLGGTRAYASPEQILGRADDIGPVSDVFALGLITHELLAGRLPVRRGYSVEPDLRGLITPATFSPADTRIVEYYLRQILAAALRQGQGPPLQTAGELGAALQRLRRELDAPSPSASLGALCREPLKALSRFLGSPLQGPLQAILRTRIRRQAEAASPPPPDKRERT